MQQMRSKTERDVTVLKNYNDKKYKLILFKSLKVKGYEEQNQKKYKPQKQNLEKLKVNRSRARAKIFEIALCNEFEYFVTLTISDKLYDRYDLNKYYKDFTQFIRNYRRIHKTDIQYMFIPEKHIDGAWHIHGLIKGILKKHIIKNKHGYNDWIQYTERFGYMSMGKIRNQEACATYMAKYLSKQMSSTITKLGANTYYITHGLKKAETMKKGKLCESLPTYDFSNDYVKIKWLLKHEAMEINEKII